MRASVFGLAAALSACGPNPNGQGVTDTGSVIGVIVDAKAPTQPINSATVQIGLVVTRLSTSDNGRFKMDGVPTGTQTIVVSSPGYQTYSSQVIVRKGQTSDVGTIGLASATGL